MDRWTDKVAVVTGTSSDIAASVAEDFIKTGLLVVAVARPEEPLLATKQKLPRSLHSRYHPRECAVTKEDEVKEAFKWIEQNLGGTDVLITNAGVVTWGVDMTTPNNTQVVQNVVDTNVMAVVYCVREAFNSMKKRNFDGHVVILNSITVHLVPVIPGISINIYLATKFAVIALNETYRQEFAYAGTKVKVTVTSDLQNSNSTESSV